MNLNISTQILGMLSFGSAALACFLVWRRLSSGSGVWGLLAAIHLMLTFEVLATGRLQLSARLRDALRPGTFYDARTGLTAVVILGALVCLLALAGWWLARRIEEWPARLAALTCLGAVFLFVLETSSLHRMDALLYRQAGPVFLIGWFWAAMSAVTVAVALWVCRKR
jgi:hypothetical protein